MQPITYAENLKRIMDDDKDGFMKRYPEHARLMATQTAFGPVSDITDKQRAELSAIAIGAFANHCSQIRNNFIKKNISG